MANKTAKRLGKIDILVNNAAIFYDLRLTPPEDLTLKEWDQVLRVNVTGDVVRDVLHIYTFIEYHNTFSTSQTKYEKVKNAAQHAHKDRIPQGRQ